MNEECTVLENQKEDASASRNYVETSSATCANAYASTEREEAPLGESTEAAAGVFTDTGTDSDFDCENSDSTHQKSELDELRGQLMQLRQELDERNAKLTQMERIEQQYIEFSALYPDTPITSLPEEVWQGVKDGNSLAAAFALAEHRLALSKKKICQSNADNRARSAGAVKSAESIEFSPAEVRAMTSAEVRANLSKIMRSMQKWH